MPTQTTIEDPRELEKLSPFEIKDRLISLARVHAQKSAAAMLNAGRGNPNWVATTPREAFFTLGQFAMTECKRVMDLADLGGMPQAEGIARRLARWLQERPDAPGAAFLAAAVPFAVERFHFAPDAFVHELVDAVVGDNYPVPDRALVHTERIVHDYLLWAMCGGRPPAGQFDLFPVEGGTAAMCYVFKSLFANRLLQPGDTIALGTPIFTPYLEMPHLNDYQLKYVTVAATQENRFQYSAEELRKLEDPAVKMFFLVNPGNPSSVAIGAETMARIVELVRTRRPDLMILTDDVYGTFVTGFRSLMAELPHNTIGVYSYSKYWGCTGWRLGVIALHEDNVFDAAIARLPFSARAVLARRYGTITLEPDQLKFIDRMVADSRDVALNHTAGLSLPQQAQMAFFSLFELMDTTKAYQASVMQIVHERVQSLRRGLGIDEQTGPLFSAYYGLLDFEYWLRRYVGQDVVDFIKAHYHPLDIVLRLAEEHGIVLLNGGGFHAPDWSARVSFANLDNEVYDDIGRAVRALARSYVEAARFAGKNHSGPPSAPLAPAHA